MATVVTSVGLDGVWTGSVQPAYLGDMLGWNSSLSRPDNWPQRIHSLKGCQK